MFQVYPVPDTKDSWYVEVDLYALPAPWRSEYHAKKKFDTWNEAMDYMRKLHDRRMTQNRVKKVKGLYDALMNGVARW
jgi:hypothetical protein